MSIRVIGPGMSLVVRAVLAMSKDRVLVGIPADGPTRRDPTEPSNAVIGFVMENGAPEINIPARPFLAPGIQDAQPEAVATLKEAAIAALRDVAALRTTASNGGAVERGLHEVGELSRDAVKAHVDKGGFIPLAPRTLAARRARGNPSTAPLLDTTQMYDAITYRVEPKPGR